MFMVSTAAPSLFVCLFGRAHDPSQLSTLRPITLLTLSGGAHDPSQLSTLRPCSPRGRPFGRS